MVVIFTIWKTISNKKLTESNIKGLLENGITKEIKRIKVIRKII